MVGKVLYNGVHEDPDIAKGQIQWGSHSDPRPLLIPGQTYTLETIEEHTWHTRYFLAEVPGHYFNSIWFTEAGDA